MNGSGPNLIGSTGNGRVPLLAVILIVVGIYSGSIYANRAFAVSDPRDYRCFPPFQPYANANMNGHLGAEYFHIAQSLAAGDGFSNPFPGKSGPTAWMAPVLPVIEAGFLKAFDGSRDAVMAGVVFLQVNTLILTGILVVAVIRKTTGRLAGWLAVPIFLAAVSCDFHSWFQFTHDCWLVLLALDLIVIGLVWVRPRPGWMAAVGWGLMGGLGAMVSPIVGFVWGILALVSGVPYRFSGRLLYRFAIPLLTAGLVVAPWTIRNYAVLGRWIPVKSNAAYELYQSQCLTPDGLIRGATFATHPNNPSGTRERQEYQELGEMAFLDHKRDQFWEAVKADPQNFFDRVADRFFGTTVWYVPFNRDEPTRRPWAYFINRATYPLPFLAAVLLVASAVRRPLQPVQWAVIGIYFLYLLPYIAVSFYNRYGAPLVVVNVLLVVWAVDRLLSMCYRGLSGLVRSVRGREQPTSAPVMARSLGLVLVLIAAASPLSAAEPEVLRADFRGKPLDQKLFQTFGVKEQIRTEPEGLRISLPGANGRAADTGIQTRFRIKGDFDITASFELLSAAVPAQVRGVGVTLHARMDDPAETSPFMGRFNRQDGTWYTCDRGAFDENRQRHIEERQFPSEAKVGRLRLMRRGTVVTYAVAEAGSDEFRRLWDWEVGTADIKALRLQAENMKSVAPLDVRFLDLEIRSGESFAKDGTPLIAEGNSKHRMLAIEILVLAVLVLLLALWRRRRNRGAAATNNPLSGQAEIRS